jgi:hypothetical protein
MLSPLCCRPFCNSPKPERNRTTFRMTERHRNHRSSSASRRSPSSITTLPAARAPAGTLLCLCFSASQKTQVQRTSRNVQAEMYAIFRRRLPFFPARSSFFAPEAGLQSRRFEKAGPGVKFTNEIAANSYGTGRGDNRPSGRPEGYNVRKAKRRHLQVHGER